MKNIKACYIMVCFALTLIGYGVVSICEEELQINEASYMVEEVNLPIYFYYNKELIVTYNFTTTIFEVK